jgi:CheY-like chemotaxis protein
VPTTLLAIDDSVTMRKVLEMTFAGEDFRVVSAESADAGFAKLRSERPSIVLCDVTLDGPGGYAICAKIKSENPTVAVVLMASKQQPYDAHKGQSARADDFIEKPFDTQQLIDKVKRLATRPVDATAAARPAAPAGPPMSVGPATQPGVAPAGAAPGRPPPAPPAPAAPARAPAGQPAAPQNRPAVPGVAAGVGRGTLAYGAYALQNPGAAASPPQAPQAPAASQATFGASPQAPAASQGGYGAARPAAAAAPAAAGAASTPSHPTHGTSPGMASPVASVAPAVASAAAAVSAASSASNGQLAAKLQHLGLSDAQVSAVLSLSREVIERVVWEVVPVLAETMIKEELKRLTSD